MANSTKRRGTAKRDKFPLTLHKSGQYRKRIRGKDFYFGTDADKALKRWLDVKDDLLAGRQPKPFAGDKITLRELANHFLTDRKAKRDAAEMTNRAFLDYRRTCELMINHFGKSQVVEHITPADLMGFRRQLSTTRGPTTLGSEIGRVRCVFLYAENNGLVDRRILFGDFKRPAKHVLRRQKAANGEKLYDAATIKMLLKGASTQMRAMILLGVNCAFGNSDCGQLPVEALDLEGGWVDFARRKTGIARRCPLWPETLEALRAAFDARKNQDDKLVFRTSLGNPWFSDSKSCPITHQFRKLCDRVGCHEEGKGFYALRHTFQTIGDEVGDYLAVKRIMGHADSSISDHYRERFSDDRLVAVADHVRGWLFSRPTVERDGVEQ